MNKNLKKKNTILWIINLILIILLLVLSAILFKMNNDDNESYESSNLEKPIERDSSLDNYSYIGIYSYSDDNNECPSTTDLVLNSDYSAIFYVGDCLGKSYYYGKYRLSENRIYLYSLILEDSSNDGEMRVDDDAIYFNLTDDTEVITSIYGHSESIRLKKLYNLV